MMDVRVWGHPHIDNMTPEEVRQKRATNVQKYGLSKEEIDRVVIPKLAADQTSEVFNKQTKDQLERESLLSHLSALRSASEYLRNRSPEVRAHVVTNRRDPLHQSVAALAAGGLATIVMTPQPIRRMIWILTILRVLSGKAVGNVVLSLITLANYVLFVTANSLLYPSRTL